MPDNTPGAKDHRATDEGVGKEIAVWNIEQSIDRGYAVATFFIVVTSIPISPTSPTVCILISLSPARRSPPSTAGARSPLGPGAFTARSITWNHNDLDKTKIAVVGHSRLGKTALLAAAFDERIALAIPLQAGCGGTGPPSRGRSANRSSGSTQLSRTGSTTRFPSSTNRLKNYPSIRTAWSRRVLRGRCSSPTRKRTPGQTQAASSKVLKAAEPVYKLLEAGGLDAEEMPPLEKLVDSTLGYYIRPGKHSMTKSDWKCFAIMRTSTLDAQFNDMHDQRRFEIEICPGSANVNPKFLGISYRG